MSDHSEEASQSKDASFLDAFKPAKLMARDAEDLQVVSAILQDAACLSKDIAWLPAKRRFAFVVNRYRWEAPAAQERVRAGVHIDDVAEVKTRGIDRAKPDQAITLLSVAFEADETPPGGILRIICAPDTATGAPVEIALHVEALEIGLSDMTRPWAAKGRPAHEDGSEG